MTGTVELQRRVIHGPGWYVVAVFDMKASMIAPILWDMYIENEWIGSRRTLKQCREAFRNVGLSDPANMLV